MKVNRWLTRVGIVFLLFGTMLIIGCSVSDEEALELGYETYMDLIQQEPNETNIEEEGVALYLPDHLVVSESTPFNMLIEEQQGDQRYLLFHYPTEPKTSSFNLERDRELEEDAIIFEVVETDEYLSFLVVKDYVNSKDEVEEDVQEIESDEESQQEDQLFVLVSIGGVKVSALSTYEELVEDIELMTKMIHSYQLIDVEESS
ncbi:hypothetical protein [Halalkalibacter sp. APA_J-10(15)]|uniref:hypothetical protein n=1 Tax=Halalkalibacter sp. APA_J-10(15) TaxID=2933805 RepID=UPI001FF691FA|nr:hypothetical protein [Halalkalibacter sp. APA_J-10(15)]MCK0471279.1 hypothetical protein [Halalkalibacter sp. APA_J-10(15)]